MLKPDTLYEGVVIPVATVDHEPFSKRSTVYDRIGEPPFDVGASQVNDTVESEATATGTRGVPGTPAGRPATGAPNTLAPTAFTAFTRNR